MNVKKDESRCDGNRKFFWKEVSKANGGKVEISNRIKDGKGWYWKRLKSIMRIMHAKIFDRELNLLFK